MKESLFALHPYLVVTTGALIFILGLWVLISAPKESAKKSLFFTTSCIGGYLLWFGSLSFTDNFQTTFLLGHVGEAFVHQISPAFYLFSVSFLRLKRQQTFAAFTPLITLIFITPLIYSLQGHSLAEHAWGTFMIVPWENSPLQLFIFFLFFFGLMGLSLKNFLWGYRYEKDIKKKKQIKYIILAFSVAYLGSWDYLTWVGFEVYPFGYFPLTLFVALLTYTLVRHNLLEINVFLKRVSLFVLIYTALAILLVPAMIFLSQNIHPTSYSNPFGIILLLSVFFGGLFSIGAFIYAALIKRSFWLRGHLTTGLTHELKSPLGAIQSSLEILLDQIKKPTSDKKKAVDYIRLMQKNTARLEGFVNDFLSLARIDGKEITLDKKETDFNQLVEKTITTYRPLLDKKKIKLSINASKVPTISCDPKKVNQVLSNLISNAVKFTEQKPISVSITQQNNHIECQVKDKGIGLSEETKSKIFTKFYQGHHSTQGTGIGLTIAKGWVEAHGGKIWAESEGEGKGTTVSFSLPYEQ